jgi:hypothetical protein
LNRSVTATPWKRHGAPIFSIETFTREAAEIESNDEWPAGKQEPRRRRYFP